MVIVFDSSYAKVPRVSASVVPGPLVDARAGTRERERERERGRGR